MDFSAYIKYGKNILKNQYDEDNCLMVLSDNGKTSRYTYNHAGERAVKSHGSMEGVYINGAPRGITLSGVDFRLRLCKSSKLVCSRLALKFHETDEYTLYPASIISVNKNRFLSITLLVISVLRQGLALVRSTMFMVRTAASLPQDNKTTLSV